MLKVSNIEVRVFIKTADSRVLNASCKNSGQNFTFLKIYLSYRISKDKWPREYLQNLGLIELNDSANNLSQIFMVQISILLVSRQFFIFSDWNIKFSNSEPVTGKKQSLNVANTLIGVAVGVQPFRGWLLSQRI